MADGGIYTRRRPAVVQLTALLDLLFIMIFIGLLTPANGEPQSEKSQTRKQLLDEVSDAAAVEGLGSHLRKMFTANAYHVDSRGRREYRDTALWAADADVGLVRFRLKLADGTAIVRTNVSEPLVTSNDDPLSECTRINLTRDRIYQNCTAPFGRTTTIDCERSGSDLYRCSESLSQTHQGRTRDWRWDYDLELISVYDARFAD
jgi:hypothetical protein